MNTYEKQEKQLEGGQKKGIAEEKIKQSTSK
jgi:hypothetical protein